MNCTLCVKHDFIYYPSVVAETRPKALAVGSGRNHDGRSMDMHLGVVFP